MNLAADTFIVAYTNNSSVHGHNTELYFALVARRKAIESVLREQFYLLIQQFAANPEKIARTLYGVSVIDINDLDIATNPTVTAFDRAKVLTVTLVRRLRQWPDLFSDVCKVLSDVPAIQEANGEIKQGIGWD